LRRHSTFDAVHTESAGIDRQLLIRAKFDATVSGPELPPAVFMVTLPTRDLHVGNASRHGASAPELALQPADIQLVLRDVGHRREHQAWHAACRQRIQDFLIDDTLACDTL
jgi:hypothetical protein